MLYFAVVLLLVTLVHAQQYSKINSEQDCLVLYNGSFSCFHILAERTNNLSFCTYPVDEEVSAEQINRCYSNVAEKNKNLAACDMFKGKEYGGCVNVVAWQTQNESLCSLIPEEFLGGRLPEIKLRDECQIGILQYKEHECAGIWDNRERDGCYLGECDSVECCQNIKGTPVSELWKNQCIGKVSIKRNDLSLCAQSKNRECIRELISSLESPLLSICEGFKDVVLDREGPSAFTECVGAVAKANEKPELCVENIDAKDELIACLDLTDRLKGCELMPDNKARNDCADYLARRAGNADYCNVITDPKERGYCRTGIFPISHDWKTDVLVAAIMLAAIILSFVFFKESEKILPLKIGLIVVFAQRMLMLVLDILKQISPEYVFGFFNFILPFRFLDMPFFFIGVRSIFPSTWTYLLFADITALLLISLVGYAAYMISKDAWKASKISIIFITIMLSISYTLFFVLMVLIALASMG